MAEAFDKEKAARALERAGLDPAAAEAIAQSGSTIGRGTLDPVPPWLAALLLGAFLAVLSWGALEIKNTGERLTLIEYKVDELETSVIRLEQRVTALEEGQRKLAAMLQVVLDRLPPRS